MGAEKFGMSLDIRETKLVWRDIPGFCRDIPEVPKKFEKKKVCVQFSFPIISDLRLKATPLNITSKAVNGQKSFTWNILESATLP